MRGVAIQKVGSQTGQRYAQWGLFIDGVQVALLDSDSARDRTHRFATWFVRWPDGERVFPADPHESKPAFKRACAWAFAHAQAFADGKEIVD